MILLSADTGVDVVVAFVVVDDDDNDDDDDDDDDASSSRTFHSYRALSLLVKGYKM